MRKSWFIRFWGFAALGLWGLMLLMLLDADHLPKTAGTPVLFVLCGGAGLVCFGIWALGSLMYHAIGRQNRQQAAIMRDVMAGLSPQGRHSRVSGNPAPAAAPAGQQVYTCPTCGQHVNGPVARPDVGDLELENDRSERRRTVSQSPLGLTSIK